MRVPTIRQNAKEKSNADQPRRVCAMVFNGKDYVRVNRCRGTDSQTMTNRNSRTTIYRNSHTGVQLITTSSANMQEKKECSLLFRFLHLPLLEQHPNWVGKRGKEEKNVPDGLLKWNRIRQLSSTREKEQPLYPCRLFLFGQNLQLTDTHRNSVHRDVVPGNVQLLLSDKIVDFVLLLLRQFLPVDIQNAKHCPIWKINRVRNFVSCFWLYRMSPRIPLVVEISGRNDMSQI